MSLILIFSMVTKDAPSAFSLCSVLLFFCPVTVTEPVCVQFKIKGCSYLWAEGVYTRSARTLSSSEYLLFGPVPYSFSLTMASDVVSGPLCSLNMSRLCHTFDLSWSFTFLLGFSQFQNITRARLYICHMDKLMQWLLWYFVKPSVIVLLAVSAVTL